MRIEVLGREAKELRNWFGLLAALLLVGLAVLVVHWLGVTLCVFHRITGLPCPTCGASRALAQLLRLQPVAAWRMQPLMVSLGAVAGIWVVMESVGMLVWRRVVRIRLSKVEWLVVLVLLAVAVVVNWWYLIRMGV